MTLIFCTRCKPSKPFDDGRAYLDHMEKRHPPLEKDVQKAVVQLYKSAGCVVYDFSQGYRPGKCRACGARIPRGATTRQTPGPADLYVLPPSGRLANALLMPWWHETKRRGGKQTTDQIIFADRNKERGIAVIVGGVNEARVHLAFLMVISS